MQSAVFYNRFWFLYPLADIFLMRQKRILFDQLNSQPPGRVLEVGVGNGNYLHRYKNHTVTGIDTSEAMLQAARKKCPGTAFNLLKMDGTAMLFDDNTFDYAVLSHVAAVASDTRQLMDEVARVLKPQGRVFILNHFTPANWLGFIDKAFSMFSGLFHFRSVFYTGDIAHGNDLVLVGEMPLGVASYFKLLIFQKK